MKKLTYIFLPLLALGVSCVKAPDFELSDAMDARRDSTVTITFAVKAPEEAETKTMADQPTITHLYVAVFGGSGYLKEYVRAEPVALATHQRDSTTDTAHMYAYQVSLSLTKSRIRVHFIANGPEELPFDYENTVIGQLTTSGGQDAYWARLILPRGIYALDDEGSRQTPPHYTVDPSFDLDDHGNHMMAAVPLVRNFAKITVTSQTQNLTVKSFAVVNVPTTGTVAAYNTSSGEFVENYDTYDFASLSAVYPGNMPTGTVIEKIIPAVEDFTTGNSGVALANSADPNVYMYERPIPESSPSFLILYATYYDDGQYSQGYDCYYKLDLMEDGNYLPIYRNFRYNIVIKGVYRPGKSNPTAAANGAGSGDISADTETASLENVSDGYASITVSYTEQIFTDEGQKSVKYRFVPNINNGTVDNSANSVTFELLPSGATGDAIEANSLVRANADDVDTYRELFFNTTEIGLTQKTQKIRIIGTSTVNAHTSRLYREVTIRLMPKQVMSLSCSPTRVNLLQGQPVDLYINIPKDLPASLFPLQFQIEASELSITPNNDNLPVQGGPSIIPAKDSIPSFQFIKTLSRDDYLTYQAAAEFSGASQVAVPCHFKTNRAISATDIYVKNKYFVDASTSFDNYIMRFFTRLEFDTMSAAEDDPVEFSFMMDEAHAAAEKEFPEYVYVNLVGLIPSETNSNLIGSQNPYRYHVSENADAAAMLQTLHLQATGETYHYSVTLSAADYEDNSLVAHRAEFSNLSYGSNTPFYGNGWPATFTFTIPTDYEMPAGGIDIRLDLTNLTRDTSDGNLSESNGVIFYHATRTGSQTLNLLTTGNRTANVSVTLVHGDFEEATLASGRRYLTIASGRITNTGPNNSMRSYNNTVNIYTNKGLSNQVGSYTVNTGSYSSSYASATNNAALTFTSNTIDATSKLYLSMYSQYNRTTYYVSTTASALYNSGNAVTVTFSTNQPGHHSVQLNTNSGNGLSYNGGTVSDDGARVTFSADALYSAGADHVKLNYGTQSFTVSVDSGKITSIVITTTGGNYRPTSQSASVGSISANNGTYTWSDSNPASSPSSVTISMTKAQQNQDRRVRISSVTVEYDDVD